MFVYARLNFFTLNEHAEKVNFMEKKILTALATGCFMLVTVATSFAARFGGEYSINVTANQLDSDAWIFSQPEANYRQQTEFLTGLDGFYVQVPKSAAISNLDKPIPYSGWGYWDDILLAAGTLLDEQVAFLKRGQAWFRWGGTQLGNTAIFDVLADGVVLGENIGAALASCTFSSPPPVGKLYSENINDQYYGCSLYQGSPEARPYSDSINMLLFGAGLIGLVSSKPRSEQYA